jgi:hypothetical protein
VPFSLVSTITVMTRMLQNLSRPILVDRIVYATITLMSVLIICDGWQTLRLIDVAGVIVGPVVAMFLAHMFSGAMAEHVKMGRVLTRHEWGAVVRTQAPFLLLCVPPLAIVLVLFALGVSPTRKGDIRGSCNRLRCTGFPLCLG